MTTHRASLLRTGTSVTAALASKTADDSNPTFAEILELVPTFDRLSPQVRSNLASGIRTFCRVMDRQPTQIPVVTERIRTMFRDALPAVAGVSPSRWRNVKSDVIRAIGLSGLGIEPRGEDVPLSDAWKVVIDGGSTSTHRFALRRFARYCCAHQIEPKAVDDATVAEFSSYLEDNLLSKTPHRIVGDLIRFWNRYVVPQRDSVYTRLTAPNRSRKYAIDWSDVHPSLARDAEALRTATVESDIFDTEARPAVRASTAVQRDRQLRRLIGAEVQRGVNPDDLHSLADVIQPDRLKEGLRFMHERCSNGSHVQLRDIHSLALVIASRWAELPRDRFEEIKKLGRGLKNARGGMTEKNRKRLAQFCDDGNVGQLLLLPEKLVRAARKGPAGYNASLKVQMAVAISILIFAPLRLGNLRTLDRTRHFYWDRSNGRRALHIVIPKDEVKNDVELEYPLPDEVTELIDHYIAKHQPRLANGHPSGLLFPGRTGQAKSESGLRNGLISTIRRETGLVMNPHLFRHLVGLLYLETNPGDYESVRLLLGHKSINTTIKFYTGQEIRRTVERYDKIILERQDAASRRLDKSKSKKK